MAAIALANGALWVTDFSHGRITRIDRKSGAIRESRATGAKPTALLRVGRALWVATQGSGTLVRIALRRAIVEAMEIAPETHMGPVELSVSDLDRTLDYWQSVVGLRVLARENGTASLGTDTRARALRRGARRASRRTATPASTTSRCSCPTGRASRAGSRTPRASRSSSKGLSDHDVSEAIYLRDPDRHGIEIYADRPRELWEGQVSSG